MTLSEFLLPFYQKSESKLLEMMVENKLNIYQKLVLLDVVKNDFESSNKYISEKSISKILTNISGFLNPIVRKTFSTLSLTKFFLLEMPDLMLEYADLFEYFYKATVEFSSNSNFVLSKSKELPKALTSFNHFIDQVHYKTKLDCYSMFDETYYEELNHPEMDSLSFNMKNSILRNYFFLKSLLLMSWKKLRIQTEFIFDEFKTKNDMLIHQFSLEKKNSKNAVVFYANL